MNYEGKTIEELKAIVESANAEIARIENKNQVIAENEIREQLEDVAKGTLVKVIFKGEEVEAVFEKLTEKRFTVQIEGVNKSIMYSKLVSIG